MKTPKYIIDIIKNPTVAFSALGTITGAVLLNLLQQFDMACKNDINAENTFIFNFDDLYKFLGMEQEFIDAAIYNLDRLELIDIYVFSEKIGANWAMIYLDEIKKFFKDIKQKQKISMQEELLKYSSIKSIGKLNKSTRELRAFVQKHSEKVIPSAVYAFCNCIINDYEHATQKPFTKIPRIWDKVLDILQKPEFIPNQFHRWLGNITFEHLMNE